MVGGMMCRCDALVSGPFPNNIHTSDRGLGWLQYPWQLQWASVTRQRHELSEAEVGRSISTVRQV